MDGLNADNLCVVYKLLEVIGTGQCPMSAPILGDWVIHCSCYIDRQQRLLFVAIRIIDV